MLIRLKLIQQNLVFNKGNQTLSMQQYARRNSDLDYPGNETIPLFCIRVMQIFIKPGILYRFLLLALAFFLSLALDIQCKQIFDL